MNTPRQKQDLLLKRRSLERRLSLKKAMADRIQGVDAAQKCGSCGYYPCQCLCDPECETCGGSGYFRDPFLKVGDKGFGRLSRCPNIPTEHIVVGGSRKNIKKGRS